MAAYCTSCGSDVGWDYGQEYADGGWYCDRCYESKSTLRESIERIYKRNKELGHTGSDMCGCSMCAAKADME